jgi:hypothetical protein
MVKSDNATEYMAAFERVRASVAHEDKFVTYVQESIHKKDTCLPTILYNITLVISTAKVILRRRQTILRLYHGLEIRLWNK